MADQAKKRHSFDLDAADARVMALAAEMAKWPSSQTLISCTEAERDRAAQGSNYNPCGWRK